MGEDYVSLHDDLTDAVPIVDDYTGQNNFHIIIANGAVINGIISAERLFSIVTYEPFRQRLLRGRASGRFFCPYVSAFPQCILVTICSGITGLCVWAPRRCTLPFSRGRFRS